MLIVLTTVPVMSCGKKNNLVQEAQAIENHLKQDNKLKKYTEEEMREMSEDPPFKQEDLDNPLLSEAVIQEMKEWYADAKNHSKSKCFTCPKDPLNQDPNMRRE